MQELILQLVDRFGYLGILLLIAIENLFPPIPSEVILTFGGFLTTCTELRVPGVILFSTLGSLLGAVILYGLGSILRRERLMRLVSGRLGRSLRLRPEDVEKADVWFGRRGRGAVFFCRFIPIVRSLISIPAGMGRMETGRFLLYTAAGSLIWNTVLVSLGCVVGESWESIARRFGEYSDIAALILGILAVSAGICFYKSRRGSS